MRFGLRRRLRALTVVALVAATAISCSNVAPGPAPEAAPRSLRILLTNDDGWSAPGIVALRTALLRAGHSVVEVAPATDQSGTAAAMTMTSPMTLTRPTEDPDVWAVSGRPADAAAVGLRHVTTAAPPDLVISGINSGNNVTTSLVHSGTVGAATTAVELGTPAIAVSGPQATPGDRGPAQFAAAADFTARLVSEVSTRPADELMPPGMVLNVNYPRVAPGQRARAVTVVPPADQPGISITYSATAPELLMPRLSTAEPVDGDDDASAVARGDVALTDLAADPGAPSPEFGVGAGLAARLRP